VEALILSHHINFPCWHDGVLAAVYHRPDIMRNLLLTHGASYTSRGPQQGEKAGSKKIEERKMGWKEFTSRWTKKQYDACNRCLTYRCLIWKL